MQVAILAKQYSERAAEAACVVHSWLVERGHQVRVDEHVAGTTGLTPSFARGDLAAEADLAVVLGETGPCSSAPEYSARPESPFWESIWDASAFSPIRIRCIC